VDFLKKKMSIYVFWPFLKFYESFTSFVYRTPNHMTICKSPFPLWRFSPHSIDHFLYCAEDSSLDINPFAYFVFFSCYFVVLSKNCLNWYLKVFLLCFLLASDLTFMSLISFELI
jgi:hypothetical protein